MSASTNSLSAHKMFVEKMWEKVRNSEFESKWKKLYDVITSDKKLSPEEIVKIDATIKIIKATLENAPVKTEPVDSEAVEASTEMNTKTVKALPFIQTTNLEPKNSSTNENTQFKKTAAPKNQRVPPLKIKLNFVKAKHRINTRKSLHEKLAFTIEESKKIDLKSKFHLKNCFVKLQRCDGLIKKPTVTSNCEEMATQSVVRTEKSPEQPPRQARFPDTSVTSIEKKSEFTMTTVSGIKEEKPQNVKCIVSHIMYAVTNGFLTLKCRSCQFSTKYLNSFTEHLRRSDHSNQRWFGLCQSCSDVTISGTGTLIDELNHMIKKHLANENISVELNLSKPSPPMVSIPSNVILEQKNSFCRSERLRPWLGAFYNNKFPETTKLSLSSNDCLAALFKCMSIDCDFFTSEPNLFQDHLALHLHYQSPDERNILSCAYCTFKGQNSQTLVDHVVNEHGADLYQCTQCFYRSFDLQVVTHMKIHHKTQPLKVIKCRVMKEKDKSEEMSQVWEQCSVNVPVITCMICSLRFINFNKFVVHLQSHRSFPSSKCIKCSKEITIETAVFHLRNCYGFGDFQCCYCRFGTDDLFTYKAHLANYHPSKMAVFFDRNSENKKDGIVVLNNLPNMLTMKQISFPHLPEDKTSLSPPLYLLRNEKRIKKLSRSYEIKRSHQKSTSN